MSPNSRLESNEEEDIEFFINRMSQVTNTVQGRVEPYRAYFHNTQDTAIVWTLGATHD